MDTSKEYIEMCEKAGEIQKWKGLSVKDCGCAYIGDWVYTKVDNDVDYPEVGVFGHHNKREMLDDTCLSTDKEVLNLNLVWLPRQDQLQEMIVSEFDDCILCMMQAFAKYVDDTITTIEVKEGGKTLEQLWLAFVMKELYSKKWNGEEWV